MHKLPENFKTILGMFYQWETSQPNVVFLNQCDQQSPKTYTWAESGIVARQLGAGLHALGLKPGDKVAIYAENSAKWFLADLAIMMAGLVSVPIYASMPEDKIRYVLDHSEAKAVFVGGSCALSADQISNELPDTFITLGMEAGGSHTWDELLSMAEKPFEGCPDRHLDDLWTICYTSGTTGLPKGVMHSFSSTAHTAMCIGNTAGVSNQSRFFSFLPLAHLAERCLIEHISIYCGGMVGFNQNLETFTDDLKQIRPTYFFSVPRIWAKLKIGLVNKLGVETWQRVITDEDFGRNMGKEVLKTLGLDCVEFAMTGAAPIPPDDLRAWQSLGLELLEAYGQTETMEGTLNYPGYTRVGSVGKPIRPEILKLSDEGEILLNSPGNMLGYYKDPKQTAKTMVDGWIHTGDKGRIDEDGFVFITGRIKEIFKTAKGKYVAPKPIEEKFAVFPGVDQCCLVGQGRPSTIMLAVFDDNAEISASKLEAYLQQINQTFEAHERISHILICKSPWTIENGLLTHTLKMLRDDIENFYEPQIESMLSSGDGPIIIET